MEGREKITVQIASIPERENSLRMVVMSLLPQVDFIRLALNNYNYDAMGAELPEWMVNDKIETIFCDNSLMDGYKFLKADQNEGYVFICDDDILYPPDFVRTMIGHLKTVMMSFNYRYPAVVSIMGKNLLPIPIKSYAKEEHECFRAFEYHSKLYEVNLIGMCGAVYHSSYCKVNETDMHVRDSDVSMSAYCKKSGIKMYVAPHRANWCRDLMQILPSDSKTMWLNNKTDGNDAVITDFINKNL